MANDIDQDCLELLLDEWSQGHTSAVHETANNAASAHSIVRHSAARKFNQEDPIEAAAAEMILQKNTGT